MKILALESSAKPCSCAVVSGNTLLGQYFQNTKLTHSRTLLSMTEALLKNLEMSLADIDLVAVSRGPGSFTGVRIGVSAAKGLAWGADIPICGVSTLEAMAYQTVGSFFSADMMLKHSADTVSKLCAADSALSVFNTNSSTLICPVMDARRDQVYNALFEYHNDKPRRLCEDRALSLEELAGELNSKNAPCLLVGDGADISYEYLKSEGVDCHVAPMLMRYQTAYGVALSAADNKAISAIELEPSYLRPSQAERMRSATPNN